MTRDVTPCVRAAALAGLLVLGLTGCSAPASAPPAASAGSSTTAVMVEQADIISTGQLVQLWTNLQPACPNPGPALPPGSEDAQAALGDRLPSVASVAKDLDRENVTAKGSVDRTVQVLRRLDAAVRQAAAFMVATEQGGAEWASDAIEGEELRFRKFEHAVFDELSSGIDSQDPVMGQFPESLTCHA